MADKLKMATLAMLLLVSAIWCQTIYDDENESDSSGAITVGALVPWTPYPDMINEYQREFNKTINYFRNSKSPVYNFTQQYTDIRLKIVEMSKNPGRASPIQLLQTLCFEFLPANVTAIVQLTNPRPMTKQFSSAEYFLQLTNYLGVPVLSTWSMVNAGLDKTFSESVVLQMTPTIGHQVSAMLSVLVRYKWSMFYAVTTRALGHEEFLQSILYEVQQSKETFHPLELVATVMLDDIDDTETTIARLRHLAEGDARVLLLHCSEKEAISIMLLARDLNLTRREFVWIVTKAVVTHLTNVPQALPVGMLGISYTLTPGQMNLYRKSLRILGHGLEAFVNDPKSVNRSLSSTHLCREPWEERWKDGLHLYHHLLGVKVSGFQERNEPDSLEQLEFNEDGTLKFFTLSLVNLDSSRRWTKVGTWQMGSLDIKDIVWPGDSTHPPKGHPENYHLIVSFLEEPPYVYMDVLDNQTDLCSSQQVQCIIPPVPEGVIDPTGVGTNETQLRCCSGFCVDLLRRLATDMSFTFEMQRVADGLWGVILPNGSWNGIMAEVTEKRVDMAVTALKINSHRQAAVDFSVPFLETGISVVVAKRTGIISPKAFLEPFDMISWFFILVVSIQAAAISIFIFEWLSPSGYDRKLTPTSGHNFSLFRTYWLVWALLFGASVNVSVPRGYTARFMANVWAGFTVVFLAIYTANLAAFMITREDFYDLHGVEDPRLLFPFSHEPALRFGTIPNGNTEDILKSNFPAMHRYMRNHSRSTVQEGIAAVKKRELDAFIYDSTVLEYLVGQDDECRLLTVGSWYAKTGYGVAFPQDSRHLRNFDQWLLYYGITGYLARLSDFWLGGACQSKSTDSHLKGFTYVAIGLKQFTSAFLLLGVGLILGFILLGLETFYFSYLRLPLARRQKKDNCCKLISLNLGYSLTFEDVVQEARDIYKYHKCKDPICDTLLWKVRHQVDVNKLEMLKMELRIKQLESKLQDAYN